MINKPTFVQPSIYLTEEEKIEAAQSWVALTNDNQ